MSCALKYCFLALAIAMCTLFMAMPMAVMMLMLEGIVLYLLIVVACYSSYQDQKLFKADLYFYLIQSTNHMEFKNKEEQRTKCGCLKPI